MAEKKTFSRQQLEEIIDAIDSVGIPVEFSWSEVSSKHPILWLWDMWSCAACNRPALADYIQNVVHMYMSSVYPLKNNGSQPPDWYSDAMLWSIARDAESEIEEITKEIQNETMQDLVTGYQV